MTRRLGHASGDRGTLVDLLVRNADQIPDSPAVTDGGDTLSWSQFEELVAAVALGLDDLGLGAGAVVGLHQANRGEHLASDLGVLSVAAVPVTVYASLSVEQITYVVADSAMQAAIVEAPHLDSWRAVRTTVGGLRHLVVVDGVSEPDEGITGWDDLVRRGRELLAAGGRTRVDETRGHLTPDSPATYIYTSGTTGPPKGVILTNRNFRFVNHAMVARFARELDAARAAQPALRDRDDPVGVGARYLSYLPLAHGAERIGAYTMALECGAHLTMVRQIEQLIEYLPKVHVSYFIAVPRIWEKLYAGMNLRLAEEGGLRGRVGLHALRVAEEWGRHVSDGTPGPRGLKLRHDLFERLLYPRLRVAVGMDRMALALTGGAPVAAEILFRFAGMGIPIIEGYGLTECTAMAAATTIGQPRPGSVGWSFTPEVELRIAEDDEILVRGPGNTPGYLGRPDATAELIDADGWLATGDLGRIDEEGALTIIGRKKELIINAAGKNMSPSQIEITIKRESPLLAQVVPFGDRQKFNVALVVLDPDALKEWAGRNGVPVADIDAEVATLSQRPDLRAEIEAAVNAGNSKMSRVEQIKRFAVLDQFWAPPDSPEVTPTMKAKRPVIEELHGPTIRELYGDDWL